MSRRHALGVLVIVVLSSSGCAKQLTRIETGVDDLTREQNRARTERQAIQEELDRISVLIETGGLSDRERRADLESRLDGIERNVEQLVAQWREQEQLLRRIRASLDLMQRQGLSAGDVPAESSPPETAAGESAPGATTGRSTPPPVVGSTGSEVFDAAFSDYTRGAYALARDGFQEVLDRFPRSELADDAQYWIGETYYAQDQYEVAKEHFDVVLQRYPEGDTLAAALLKMGYCELELGAGSRARQLFERVKTEYPDSDEAMIADHKISSLPNGR